MKNLILLSTLMLMHVVCYSQSTLIPFGSSWKYLDIGGNQNTSWRSLTFNDASWSSGVAEFGYGDGDEATVVSYGPNGKKKYITTYFRKSVFITNPAQYSGFTLSLKRDDGAVVYINGNEVWRSNMPSASINSSTKASSEISDDGVALQVNTIAPSFFSAGNNVIAIEIHQSSASGLDISFDAQLVANASVNQLPVANAGTDQSITLPTSSVTLSGSASDTDGTIATYAWTRLSGPTTVTIASPSSASTSVTGLTVAGTYVFRLAVTDNVGATATDDVSVVVNSTGNQAPVANAGTDKTITLPTSSVTLSGSATDTDGTIATYAWTRVSGPTTVTIASPSSASTSVTGLTLAGTYVFRLTVTDNLGASASDDINVVVNPGNQTPTANAGTDQSITLPTSSVTLSGSATDTDGTIATYAWTRVSGPTTVTIASPSSASTSVTGLTLAGTYVFRLTVTDNLGATASDDINVVVNPGNQTPTANAGTDQSITLPTSSVTLSGSATDADGTIATYAWTRVSGPTTVTIASPSSASTTVTGLTIAGTYVFRLTVTDNLGATASDDMNVVVNPGNQTPTANAGTDQTITLPTSSVTLSGSASDADGTIATYAWTRVSGPTTVTIAAPSSASTSISGLTVAGTYVFRLTVTDNLGATASDDVNVVVNPTASGPLTILTWGTSWKYLDNGSNQGTSWSGTSFNDTAWPSGLAELGYGDSPVTTLNYGPDANNKYITYYFRKLVNFASPSSYSSVTLNIRRDDGAVVYVNGTEVYRNNLASGTISYTTLASDASDDGATIQTTTIPISAFVAGNNIVAVEIHQTARTSSDVTFDMELVATGTSGNQTPLANAGTDKTITLPTSSVTLTGSASDPDGTISTYAWTRVSGPTVASISTPSSASTSITGLTIAGTYVFRLTVTDNIGATASDDVNVLVNSSGQAITLTRGPYLQMANETAVTLRWRTDIASDSKIDAGTVFGTYTLTATNATSTTEHEVRISGLSPDTKYYYRFGSSTSILQATTSNYFTTAPPATTTRKIRIAAFGDCGTSGSGNQAATLSSYQNYTGANPAELMLLLGDNAYENGTDSEYQTGFFNAYSSNIIKNHILFPAPGNHDYANTTARQIDKNIPYYNIFTLPKAAESGGVASGTESYYSYNWGNIHFMSLDSYGMETSNNQRLYDTLSPQVTWIKQDLAANTKKWTVVYWHHPPYTMGSHNSDTESELVKTRQNFIRILERYGVDMILCGHSHDYERSYLLKGYYTNEASFSLTTHAVNSSSGKYNGSTNSCAFQTTSKKENHGTVYVVAGSSGSVGSVQAGYPHNALPFSFDEGGVFYFEVEDNRLDAKFIRRDGVIADQFTIMKDVAKTTTVNITAGQNVTLTASWKGTYNWSTGATTRSIVVSPANNTTYTCTDGVSCIVDQFNVTTGSASARMQVASEPASSEVLEYSVFPVPVKRGEMLTIQGTSKDPFEITVMNATGMVIRQLKAERTIEISTADMAAGLYYVNYYSDLKTRTKKFMVLD